MEIIKGSETKELLEAQAHIWNYTFNYITSMSLKCAVQLGIPDIISSHGKPITLTDLVKALSISHLKSSHLYRLMRILVHSGFFSIDEEHGYMLTPSSKLLLKSQSKTNLSPFLLMITHPVTVTPFHFLSTFLKETELSTPMEAAFGMNLWGYCSKNPGFNKIFNDAMASDSNFVMSLVVKDCKKMFEGSTSLVDVGGGTGTVSMALSEAFPNLKCTVFDLPHVVADMVRCKNIEFVAGDMLESIPCADIVLLKWIMHDWSDEDYVKILVKCREAIPSKKEGGKVVIIDIVIDLNNEKFETTESQLCFDMIIMAVLSGKERTENEFKKLFLEAGFTSYKITPGLGLRSIIEVFP